MERKINFYSPTVKSEIPERETNDGKRSLEKKTILNAKRKLKVRNVFVSASVEAVRCRRNEW